MGSYTNNLGLYKVNTETDGNDTFNIDTMMNDNWDIIDAFSKGLRMKTYTNLSQIGLTAGSETIESILTAMPVNSILYVEVGASNADIYPTQYGMFIAKKLSASRWFAEFYPKETTDLYVCSAKTENSTFTFYDWKKKADYDDIEEVKKSVSDGKTLVANAITAKGVSTAANATFQTMADNVSSIITLDSVPHTTADGTVYENAYINTNEVKYVIDFTNLNNAVYTNSSSVKMSHACYGDGNIVFIAQTGDIFYSSNGSDWNTSTVDTGSTSTYKSIVYGNGKYVVLEYDSAKVYVSTDLINWEAVSTGVTGGDIAFGDGRFVISSNGNSQGKQFAYSDDAVNWVTTDYIHTNIQFSLVEYCGNNTFLAASRVNTAYYVYLSTDGGVTWTGSTKLPTSSSTRIYSVAYGNGIYVMKGASSILTSTDGLNWSLSSTSISAEILYFDEDIKMFICVGDRVIGYSKDAVTWNTFDEYLIPYYDINQNKLSKSVGVAIKFGNKIFIASDESWRYISSINHEYMVLCKIPNNTYLDGVDYVKYTP